MNLALIASTLLCIPPALQVDAGDDVACARIGGQVYCWGENNDGELGDGTRAKRRNTATMVLDLADAIDVSVGDDINCAVKQNGDVVCWGEGFHPSSANRRRPERVEGAGPATQVQAIDRSACAVRRTGQVVCWGGSNPPTPIKNLGDALQLVTRRGLGCARRANGRVDCWSFERARIEQVEMENRPLLHGAGSLAISDGGVCGVMGGRVRCGAAIETTEKPRDITGIADAVGVSMAGDDICVLRRSGRVACSRNLRPPSLRGPWLADLPVVAGARDISVGEGFACAAVDGPEVVCWGKGGAGQLGHGEYKSSVTPVTVKGLSRVRLP